MKFETLRRIMASSVNSSEVVFNTVEGEQTIDDDSMFRPMSLANLPELNNDPSADKSTTAYKMWNDYRESKSPNDDVEEDEEIDENGGQEEGSTPRIRVCFTRFSHFFKKLN